MSCELLPTNATVEEEIHQDSEEDALVSAAPVEGLPAIPHIRLGVDGLHIMTQDGSIRVVARRGELDIHEFITPPTTENPT